MKLQIFYTLSSPSKSLESFGIPLRIEKDEKSFEITKIEDGGKSATVVVGGKVDPSQLKMIVGPERWDNGESDRSIEVPEAVNLTHFFSLILKIFSFLTDIPIHVSRRLFDDQLIPETLEEAELLKELGTNRIHLSGGVSISSRSFRSPKSLSDTTLILFDSLSKKESGLEIYTQAIRIQESVASFREFWKILEAAFGVSDDKLIEILTDFKPAKELGFTKDELKELLVLRGRASHAESKSGIRELRAVITENSDALPRLKNLAEQVILTKKTWGIPTRDIERLARLTSYAGPYASPVIVKKTPKARTN